MISIIVPIYNVSKYLGKCLSSIKNQTYVDFEVLMINDGSTDDSQTIAENFIGDRRFRLINKVNGGLSSALNIGLDNIKGDFICFIDSDDFVEPEFLKSLYDELILNNADIAQCGINRVWGGKKSVPYGFTGLESRIYTDITEYIKESSFVKVNKLYRKDLYEGLRYSVGVKFEDFILSPQVYARANKIVATERRLYNYLWRSDSITNSLRVQPDILRAFQTLEATDFGIRNKDIMCALFVRQVMGSLIWAMMMQSQYIQDAIKIMACGKSRYAELETFIKKKYIGKNKVLWGQLMVRGHYTMARFYSCTYSRIYSIFRSITRR